MRGYSVELDDWGIAGLGGGVVQHRSQKAHIHRTSAGEDVGTVCFTQRLVFKGLLNFLRAYGGSFKVSSGV